VMKTSPNRYSVHDLLVRDSIGNVHPARRYSYESMKDLYDVVVMESGVIVQYSKNGTISSKEKHHELIEQHYSL